MTKNVGARVLVTLWQHGVGGLVAHFKGSVSNSALDYYKLRRGTLGVWVLFSSPERAILERFGSLDPFLHEENGFTQFTAQPTLIMVLEGIF